MQKEIVKQDDVKNNIITQISLVSEAQVSTSKQKEGLGEP